MPKKLFNDIYVRIGMEPKSPFNPVDLVTDLNIVLRKLVHLRDACKNRAKELASSDRKRAKKYLMIVKKMHPLLQRKDNLFVHLAKVIKHMEKVH